MFTKQITILLLLLLEAGKKVEKEIYYHAPSWRVFGESGSPENNSWQGSSPRKEEEEEEEEEDRCKKEKNWVIEEKLSGCVFFKTVWIDN